MISLPTACIAFTCDDGLQSRDVVVCRHAPFLIAFQERAQVFTTVVEQDRMEQRAMGVRQHLGWGHQHFVTIHRTSLLQVRPSLPLGCCPASL